MARKVSNEELIRQDPGSLVKQIVKEIVSKKAVDVHFEPDDEEDWAVVRIHTDDEDKELAIRLLTDDRWVLLLGYYDEEDEYIELVQPLTKTEIDLIPPGLQKVMRKVLTSEEGLRVPGSLLAK